MATNDKPAQDKAPEVQMPQVEEPAREKAAGKWLIWFIVIFAIALLVAFLF